MKKISINSLVKFQLSDYGKQMLNDYVNDLLKNVDESSHKDIKQAFLEKIDENDFITMQIHQFAYIFGSKLDGTQSKDFPFTSVDMIIDDEEIKEVNEKSKTI